MLSVKWTATCKKQKAEANARDPRCKSVHQDEESRVAMHRQQQCVPHAVVADQIADKRTKAQTGQPLAGWVDPSPVEPLSMKATDSSARVVWALVGAPLAVHATLTTVAFSSSGSLLASKVLTAFQLLLGTTQNRCCPGLNFLARFASLACRLLPQVRLICPSTMRLQEPLHVGAANLQTDRARECHQNQGRRRHINFGL